MGKRTHTEGVVTKDGNIDKLDELVQAAIIKKIKLNPPLDPKRMRTNLSLNPKLRTDLGRISDKNPLV